MCLKMPLCVKPYLEMVIMQGCQKIETSALLLMLALRVNPEMLYETFIDVSNEKIDQNGTEKDRFINFFTYRLLASLAQYVLQNPELQQEDIRDAFNASCSSIQE